MKMKNALAKTLAVGQRVIVLNKFNDEIADGFVTETMHNGFQMKDSSSGDDIHVSWKNIVSAQASEITLNVAS